LTGSPATAQAEALLARHAIDALILIDVDDAVVTERALARRLCSACGRDHNLLTAPPRVPCHCDACGGALSTREDDTPEGVARRLAAYHASTEPALEPFRRRCLVRRVDGVGTIDEVARRIGDALGQEVVQAA
jgi:adenylate kinase